jgi:NNP family nitrate/nitrite transporter-like MFS transporter
MRIRDFLETGHWPTLLSAFLYFDVSFMVWVLFGALANSMAPELGLTAAEKGVLVAVPILGGALLRVPLGILADRIGGRRAGLVGIALTLVPLILIWRLARSFAELSAAGLLLGVAGASFAVALPLASRWYPPRSQGLVMGIAGAGNSGTVLAALFAPRLAQAFGWHTVFGLAAGAMVATLAVFALLARDSPSQPPPARLADYLGVSREPDVWWFAAFYAVTFGGFVGFASYLAIFFHDHHGLGGVAAGTFTAICVVAGSFLRPAGGWLADRLGGLRVLAVIYLAVGSVFLVVSLLPPLLVSTVLLFLGMGLLGMGNGAVFQLVPQRFGREIGTTTGIIGAAGGLGGFLLPTLLGALRQVTGAFGGGFLVFAVVSFGCVVTLLHVGRAWQSAFLVRGGLAPALVPAAAPADLKPFELEPHLEIAKEEAHAT